MTLIHGAGVDWPGPRMVTYSAPSRANPPSPLKNSRSGGRALQRRRQTRDDALRRGSRQTRQAPGCARAAQTARRAAPAERPARRNVRRARVSAAIRSARSTKTRPAGRSAPGLRTRLACPDQRLDGDLKLLDIGGSALVQDDEIDGELFHPPIFVRLQQFADDVEMLDIGDAQQARSANRRKSPAATGRTARRRPARSCPRTGARPAPA